MIALRPARRLSSALAAAAAAVLGLPAAQAADPLPRNAQELTQKRSQMGPGGELFGAGALAPSARKPQPQAAPQASVPPPQPPALPFTYGGSGVVNGKAIVFLERPMRSVMVSPGDVVDGVYRVEAIERNRARLRYLPLGAVQVMVFVSPDTVRSVAAATPRRAQGPLFVEVPDEAPLDREVPVVLGIPPGSVAAKATIRLDYDENALSVTGAKIVRPGRAVIEVSAQDAARSKELRLKALGTEVSSTEISIDIVAFDAQGQSLAVRMPPHHISLVEALN